MRWTNGEKSGLTTGVRSWPMISPPAALKALLESGAGADARTVIGHHRVDLLDALVGDPFAEVGVDLAGRGRGADHVGRLGDDHRRRRVHDDHELLGFGRNIAHRECVRRQKRAGQDVDLVTHDEFLGEALGDVGRDAADILADDLDLLAGDHVAVFLNVELDAVVELRARIGELTGIGVDDADFHGVLGHGRATQKRNCHCADSDRSLFHGFLPDIFVGLRKSVG